MNLQLNDKRAFISGSTQGIGYAIATSLLEEGASVVLNGRSQDKLDRAVKKLKQKFLEANLSGIAVDFTDAKQVEELLLQLSDIDILINNVGLFELKPFAEITDIDPSEIANLAVYLASPLSSATNGSALRADGGVLTTIL